MKNSSQQILSVVCWPFDGRLLARLLADCWPFVGKMLAKCDVYTLSKFPQRHLTRTETISPFFGLEVLNTQCYLLQINLCLLQIFARTLLLV